MATGDHTNSTWQVERLPCLGRMYHDFVMGPTHAICNRCEKIVKIGGEMRWEPNRIGGWGDQPLGEVRFDSNATKW